LGKKFKLEVWEVIVQKMALNEVARFTVDKSVRKTSLKVEKGLISELIPAGSAISVRVEGDA
jgi:AH receptor-interacting protein